MDDLISRQGAVNEIIKYVKNKESNGDLTGFVGFTPKGIIEFLKRLPSEQPEIVRCRECKFWEKKEDSTLGYCNSVKHCHYSDHLEIQIYSRYEADFFCADGERRIYE